MEMSGKVLSLPSGGTLLDRDPLPHGDPPSWTETPPPGQKPHGQRPPSGQRPPRQKKPLDSWTETLCKNTHRWGPQTETPLDKDPWTKTPWIEILPGQRHPWIEISQTETPPPGERPLPLDRQTPVKT